MNHLEFSIYPPCEDFGCTVSELPRKLETLDLEPEELQRGVVSTEQWGGWVIFSILMGIRLAPFTWSYQKESYMVERGGKKYRVEEKNIDSLQRITNILKFNDGIIRLPDHKGMETIKWIHAQEFYKEDYVNLRNLNSLELKDKYPEFYRRRYEDYKLRIDRYGNELHQLSKKQETFLFRTVLNNGNEMNAQQKRNPTVAKIAEIIRTDARLNPIDIMTEGEYFGFENPKMEYDLLLAEMYHWILNGVNAQPTSQGLDDMYDDPKLEDSVEKIHSSNHKYKKKIDLKEKVNEVLDFMLDIIRDKQYKAEVNKGVFRSLFMFSWLHLTEFDGNAKFSKKGLKKLFFSGHTKMVDTSSLPKAARTTFGDALVTSNTASNKTKARLWREELGWKKDFHYDED